MRARWLMAWSLNILAGAAVVPGAPAVGWGYDEITVRDGGAISGRVVLNGPPPPARIYHMVFSPNIDFCTRISDGNGNRLLREFLVADDGAFQDVVVAVVGVERGKAFDFTPSLTLEHCRMGPFVTAVRNGHPMSIVNKDPVVHDVQGYTSGNPYTFMMFNKPMLPESSASKQVRLRDGHFIFRTQCGVHDFMQSWGMAVGNPYFAVTGPDGTFTISDLPPGTYDVVAWHPHMTVKAQRVTVQGNGTAPLHFAFDASETEIPLHALQTNYRLQPALDLIPLAAPSVELQVP
jgi:hypothetical protein